MKWPFNTKSDTDLRVYRDPETNEVKLRLVGPIAFPAAVLPILAITITLEAVLDQDGIERLYKQLQHFAKEDLNGTSRP